MGDSSPSPADRWTAADIRRLAKRLEDHNAWRLGGPENGMRPFDLSRDLRDAVALLRRAAMAIPDGEAVLTEPEIGTVAWPDASPG